MSFKILFSPVQSFNFLMEYEKKTSAIFEFQHSSIANKNRTNLIQRFTNGCIDAGVKKR